MISFILKSRFPCQFSIYLENASFSTCTATNYIYMNIYIYIHMNIYI